MEILRAGICKAGFLFILLLVRLFTVNGQYKVSGEIIDVGLAFENVHVALETGGLKRSIALTCEGKFYTYLQWNRIYRFSFKKKGYVTKVIEFSTVLPENVFPESIQPYFLPVRLFEIFEGVDTVFFNHPVAKIRYDQQLSDFVDDRDYSLKVRYKINEMRKAAESVKEEKIKPKVSTSTDNKSEKIQINKSTLESASKSDKNIKEQQINGLPPLKPVYQQGRTDERFELEGRVVERTIFVFGNLRKVYYMVKHEWGGVFYFIDQADLGCRCISKEAYFNLLINSENNSKTSK